MRSVAASQISRFLLSPEIGKTLLGIYVVVSGGGAGPWQVPRDQRGALHGRYRAGEDQQGKASCMLPRSLGQFPVEFGLDYGVP